jgi:lipopolysaccharide biosynthesis glycosyltransferase
VKWYFAFNDNIKHADIIIKAMVESALQNTTLEPVCIYDGVNSNDLIDWLKTKGVQVIPHRVGFYDALESYYKKHNNHKIATGAYLRCDIPILNTEDDFALYTDCDVIFLKDFDYQNLEKPEYFSCSSEIMPKNFKNFNTGVMYMNLKNLRKTHTEFTDYIQNNFDYMWKTRPGFDQTAYQCFYGSRMTKLPLVYNHKPYWGINEDAVIVHYHGFKPYNFMGYEQILKLYMDYRILFNMNPKGVVYYLKLFKKYYPDIEYPETFLENVNKLKGRRTFFRIPWKKRLKRFIKKIFFEPLSLFD